MRRSCRPLASVTRWVASTICTRRAIRRAMRVRVVMDTAPQRTDRVTSAPGTARDGLVDLCPETVLDTVAQLVDRLR